MSFFSALFGGGDKPVLAPVPPPPANDAAAQAARDRAAEEERVKRVAAGKAATNPTGGLGDTSAPNLAAKNLLGQ